MIYRTAANLADGFARAFAVQPDFDWRPRYNIVAPSQDVPIVTLEDGKRTAHLARWSLVPSWARDPAIGNPRINARYATVFG